MEIQTKFSLGDKVWLMWSNSAIQREVSRIYVFINDEEQYESYGLKFTDDEEFVNVCDVNHEAEDLFRTKQELLDSL